MAGRASIVGAAATHVGKVREHNEDAHFFDADAGVFVVCDGMGGHAAGEVASALAIRTIRSKWASDETANIADEWLARGTPEARKQLLGVVRAGVIAAHDAILADAAKDQTKAGMGTTLVGAMIVGTEAVFAHAGDSRAYIVRDGIAMQLTEDHTLLARLLAAGIDVDVSGEGSRFRSMLTNALGIGDECRVSTFVVPLADGDRFLLCSDGISEYVPEVEVGTVLSNQPSPARAAQKLIELALERGGGDNATAVVVRVLEAGERPQPAELRKQDDAAIEACPLWGGRVTPQQRLRALRIAISRDFAPDERLPAHTLGDRVAWIIVAGELSRSGIPLEPGAFLYPESLIADSQAPHRDSLAVARTDVRALALRADDFRELCDEDSELGEALLEAIAPLISRRSGVPTRNELPRLAVDDGRSATPLATPRLSVPAERPEPPVPAPTPAPPVPAPAAASPAPAPATASPVPAPMPRPLGPAPAVPAPAAASTMSPAASPVPPPAAAPARVPELPRAIPAVPRITPIAARPVPTPVPTPTPPGGTPRSPAGKRSQTPAEGSALLPPSTTRPTTPPPIGARRVTPVRGSARLTPPPGISIPAAPVDLPSLPTVVIPPPPPPRSEPAAKAAPAPATAALPEPPPLPPPDEERTEIDPLTIMPRIPARAMTEPEIEAYFEIEAEPPPDLVEREEEHETMIVSVDDGTARITETVVDDSDQTMTLSVTESTEAPEPAPARPRTITPQDSPTASGSIDTAAAPRRSKRISEGWDD